MSPAVQSPLDLSGRLFSQLSDLLDGGGCPTCRARGRSGGRCPECEESVDVQECLADRKDRAHFRLLQSAFDAFQRGQSPSSQALEAATHVRDRVRQGMSQIDDALEVDGISEIMEEILEGIYDSMEELDDMLGDWVSSLQLNDLMRARVQLDEIRVHMRELDDTQCALNELIVVMQQVEQSAA